MIASEMKLAVRGVRNGGVCVDSERAAAWTNQGGGAEAPVTPPRRIKSPCFSSEISFIR